MDTPFPFCFNIFQYLYKQAQSIYSQKVKKS